MLDIFIILLFIILCIVNYVIKRDILSPSFILSSIWAIYVFLLYISRDFFYEISFETYGIYFIAAFMFSIGEVLEGLLNKNKLSSKAKMSKIAGSKRYINKKENYIMFISLCVLIVALPLYYKYVVNFAGSSLLDIKTFFWRIRRASLDRVASGAGGFSLLKNLVPLSSILAVYFYSIYKKNKQNRILVYAIIGVAIIYQLLTGGRSGAVYMVLSLIGVEIIREKKIKISNLMVLGGALLFVIIFIAYFVSKGDVDNTKSLLQNIDAFYKDIIVYLLGGMVAFNNIVIYEGSIPSNGGVARFFLQTARSLGFNVDVPSLHMPVTNIGPNLVTNVYTIYSYYYIDYGLIGTCLLMLLLGIISSFIYKKAKNGSDFFCPFYGFFVAGLMLSVFSEYFYSNLNLLIKAVIVITAIEFIKKLNFSRYVTNHNERELKSVKSSGIYRGS